MADDKQGRAIVVLLEAAGIAYAGAGVSTFLQEGLSMNAGVQFGVALILITAGLRWSLISEFFGERFGRTASSVASDFRWWFAALLVLFLYLGLPRILRRAGLEAELGDPTENKYVCTKHIRPISFPGEPSAPEKAWATLIEFGVRRSATNGIQAQITLERPWGKYRVWVAASRRATGFPPKALFIQEGNTTWIRTQDPKVFDIETVRPDITPRMSLYVYFESDASNPYPTKVRFVDDVFALDDLTVLGEAPEGGWKCPY